MLFAYLLGTQKNAVVVYPALFLAQVQSVGPATTT